LVAYVVSEDGEEVSSSELRSYLKEKLPEYMIPSQFVHLAELPLTANGKVDRRALRTMVFSITPEETYVAPQTAIEEVLAGIWAEVLRVDRVGRNDNFFALGGHSLLATQVVSYVREIFHFDLPLRNIFEAPNVADLAEWMLRHSDDPARIKRTAELMLELDELSDAEVGSMLSEEAVLEQKGEES